MTGSDTFRQSLSAGGLDAIEPFLPYLLQDLWELGGSPEAAIRLLDAAGVAPAANDRVVDLGCGKGAMLIEFAKRYRCRGYGVDLMPEFIDEAQMFAREHGVSDRVEFRVGDMRDAVRNDAEHAWIVYGHDAPILGNLAGTLRALRRTLLPGGHLILDATCRKPGAGGDAEEFPLLSEMDLLIRSAGFAEAGREIISADEARAGNAEDYEAIERRANELKRKHPERAVAFDAYLENQREECRLLENSCDNALFLLRAI